MTSKSETHPIKNRLISNTFFISLEWAFVSFTSFLYWLIIGKTLPPSDYGIVNIFTNFTVILASFIPLGTSVALFKLIPEYLERKEFGKITSSIRFTIKVIVITTVVISAIIIVFSDFISSIFKLPNPVILLLPISLFGYAIFNHQAQIMLGFQHAKKLALTSAIGYSVKVTISALLILTNMHFFGPIIGFVVSSIMIFLMRINYLLYDKKPSKIDGKKIIITFGLSALVLRIAMLLFNSSPPLILSLFHTPEVVGIFGIAILLANQLHAIPTIFSSALFPITSHLSVIKNTEKRQTHLINLVVRYSLLITLPLLIFIILFSGKLIMLISQEAYLPAKSILPILSIGSIIFGISFIFVRSIYALGKADIHRNIILFSSAIFIFISIPSAYFFSVLGISFAYTISTSVLFITSLIFLKKLIKYSPQWKTIGKLLIANLISLSILYFLSNLAPNIWIGILYTLIIGMFYLILLLFLRFYTKDDITLIKTFSDHIPVGKNLIKIAIRIMSNFIEK